MEEIDRLHDIRRPANLAQSPQSRNQTNSSHKKKGAAFAIRQPHEIY